MSEIMFITDVNHKSQVFPGLHLLLNKLTQNEKDLSLINDCSNLFPDKLR